MDAERKRLQAADAQRREWKKWGPYLSERQWGTVREDYSPHGTAWEYFTHDMARSRAYRWGEDGIGGISDEEQLLCFSVALWNRKDPIIKERLYGITGNDGNHGEDVKELYYYLDSTPTHSYMKMLYKYPQRAFPYQQLDEENRRRTKQDPEFELIDTGIFDDHRYFDVFIEYVKVAPEDILIRITAHNRGPDQVHLDVIPQVWFRNTWGWGDGVEKPELYELAGNVVQTRHAEQGVFQLYCDGSPELLFCENETNYERLSGLERVGYYKDGVNDYLVHGANHAVNAEGRGTKAAAVYRGLLAPGGSYSVRLRLTRDEPANPFQQFDRRFQKGIEEADEFYESLQHEITDEDDRRIQRQAFAGLLWTKQFYNFDVARWIDGDPGQPPPPAERKHGRNADWRHLHNADVISMPDKWEYPWYAAWDLAFHCLPIAMLDPDFAKRQLVLMTREWYMHPNGQLPAYEWAFGDVNPPVHAWATWRVFQIDRKLRGKPDLRFLERVFHKLMLNFTWWVNRKDLAGRNVFQGGFLGLDNIGVFDRSAPLPMGGYINQADGTSWMAMYSLNLMRIALELAKRNSIYEDIAGKFFEHFLYIAEAMTNMASKGIGLWDEEDEFYYDVLNLPNNEATVLKIRSMVGLIPLFAVETLEPELLERLPHFHRRMRWFLEHRPDLAGLVSRWTEPRRGDRRLLSLLRGRRMKRLLRRMLDETEFLSHYGIRALSKHHLDHPYVFSHNGVKGEVRYQPGESESGDFGGNSNWRGPIWMPVNYLLIESLQKFHHYYGDDFLIECPTNSGRYMTINQVADEIGQRLMRIFRRDEHGRRAVNGPYELLQRDPHFKDYLLFYEYFHGENGRGVGASHQTGWTGLIAKLLQPRHGSSPDHVSVDSSGSFPIPESLRGSAG